MFSRLKSLAVPLLVIWSTSALCADQDINLNDAFVVNKLIGRGVNIGNALDREAEKEDEWGLALSEERFQLIKDANFNSVRLTVRWSDQALNEPPYTIDPKFFERVDWAVQQVLSRNMALVINVQNYFPLYRDPNGQIPKFLAMWKQIAEHYQGQPNTLIFELLNEPQQNIDASGWNTLLKKTLKIVRKTNPDRTVVIGPANFNGLTDLRYLEMPEDDHNIIVTIHYYQPYQFTHQGAPWENGSTKWLGLQWEGNEEEKRKIKKDFDAAAGWARKHNRPIYLGEFGCYEKADMDSRIRWTKCVADEAVGHGFSFTYWQFAQNFAVYDRNKKEWIKPLLDALVPPKQ